MKKYIILSLLMISVLFPVLIFAQTDVSNRDVLTSCVSLQNNLRHGSRDANTNGEISILQSFLKSKNYLNYRVTGYFGPLTLAAVKNFQRGNDIISTGYVGPITRARISVVSCGTMAPTISFLFPTSGPVGTSVTITGNRFTPMNNSVKFGEGYINGLDSSAWFIGPEGQTQITFTVPDGLTPCLYNGLTMMPCPAMYMQITPGSYSVSVINENGTSNAVNFIVVSG